MQAPSGQRTAPPLQALLEDRTLAGEWALDPGQSSIRLKNRSVFGLMRVNGVFREVSGNGTVSPDGEVSGTVTVAAASSTPSTPAATRTCARPTSSTAPTIRTSSSPRTVSGRPVRVSP